MDDENQPAKGPGNHNDLLDLVLAAYKRAKAARRELESDNDRGPLGKLPSDRIPGYRVTRPIGRGGQGEVFQATQQSTSRAVAIKILRPFAEAAERTRFRREVDSLTQLHHPNIPRLIDCGEISECPYLVRDYVSGKRLDDYLKSVRLGIRQTVELFLKICDAVAAAQGKTWVHRDLKPANILIDDRGEPQVLDFGMAKLLDDDGVEQVTRTGCRIGTLAYAAPEQFNGEWHTADVRMDVWSLAVILYGMLTGKWPWGDLESGDIEHRIRFDDPIPPRCLRSEIDDDVETFMLKCLKRDPEARYRSAEALGDEIRRYLNNQPIEAKRDKKSYLAAKWSRRHWRSLASIASLFLLLIAGLIVSRILYHQAEVGKDYATSKAILLKILLSPDPNRDGKDVTVQAILQRTLADLESGALSARGAVEAPIRAAIGASLYNLGEFRQSEVQLRKARSLYETNPVIDPLDYAQCLNDLAILVRYNGTEEPEPIIRKALELRQRHAGKDSLEVAESLNNLGYFLRDWKRYQEAEDCFRRALDIHRQRLEMQHPKSAQSLNSLGHVLRDMGQQEEAESCFRRAREIFATLPESPDVAHNLNDLADVMRRRGQADDGDELDFEALSMFRRTLPLGHDTFILAAKGLTDRLIARGKTSDAVGVLTDFVSTCEVTSAPVRTLPIARRIHAKALRSAGRFDEAEQHLRLALEELATQVDVPPARFQITIQALLELYVEWDAAERGQGYDQKAAEWQAKLEEWQASTQPAESQAVDPALD